MFTPKKVVIIKAAVVPQDSDIVGLKRYKALFGKTPELSAYKGLPIRLELVYAVPDGLVLDYARRQKVNAVFFRPPWVSDYLAMLPGRKRRGPLV